MRKLKLIILISVLLSSLSYADKYYVEKELLIKIIKKYKKPAKKKFLYLQKQLNSVKDLDELSKLKAVNDFFGLIKKTGS